MIKKKGTEKDILKTLVMLTQIDPDSKNGTIFN